MPSWEFADYDAIAAANPYTCYKPPASIIARIRVGERVKLCFNIKRPIVAGSERMRVTVDSLSNDGGFTGQLDDEPQFIDDLHAGDAVSFRACHIIGSDHDLDSDNPGLRYARICVVTNRVLREHAEIGFMGRQEPTSVDDSGWRVRGNDETSEYLQDTANFSMVPIGVLVKRDESLLTFIDAPPGTEFFRMANAEGYVWVPAHKPSEADRPEV